MGSRRATDEAVLTALRVAPATEEDLGPRTGVASGVLADALERLAAGGLARRRDEPPVGWSLTAAGRREAERAMAASIDAAEARSVVVAAYEVFRRLDPRLKAACTRWQVRPVSGVDVVNDHADPDHDAAAVAELEAVHAAVLPVVEELGAAVTSYDGYGRRFSNAIGRVRDGDGTWFAHPLVDSYHTVWFELHEHLLASLGLDRSSEARTDTEPDGSHRPSTLRDAPRGAPTSTQSDPKPDDPSPHPPPDGLRSPSQEAT